MEFFKDQSRCKIFKILFDNYSCIRCILRVFKVTTFQYYRDKTLFINWIQDVSDSLKLEQNLIEEYDFNYIIRKTPFILQTNQSDSTKTEEQQINTNLKVEDSQVEQETDVKLDPPSFNKCTLCLGILQDVDQKQKVAQIVDYIQKDDCDFESYKFAIQMPLSQSIRFMNMVYFLENELINQNDPALLASAGQIIKEWKVALVDVKAVYQWILAPLISETLDVKSSVNEGKYTITISCENEMDDKATFEIFYQPLTRMNEEFVEKQTQKKKKFNNYPQENLQAPRLDPCQANFDRISKIPRDFATKEIFQGPPPMPVGNSPNKLVFTYSHESVYLMGNYVKLVRYMSQSPWIIDGKRPFGSSIQEQIANEVIDVFQPRDYKFSTGGRQDIDVRMLGNGRPFVIQVIDPHRTQMLKDEEYKAKLLAELNDRVNKKSQLKINSLKFTDISCYEVLKESETNQIKAYCCFVQCSTDYSDDALEQLNQVKDMVIKQKTPIRVLHRRTLMIRDQSIFKLKAIQINSRHFVLYVLASAGTYIKEFVHGDLERTLPNVGTIINSQADIFQLDVIKLYEKISPEALQDFDKISRIEPKIEFK